MALSVGAQIREKRDKAGITQEELAARAGLSRNTIINFETNRRVPKVTDLEKIAHILGCEIVDFFSNPTPPPATGPGGEEGRA